MHVDTRYELVNMNMYRISFLKHPRCNNAIELQDCERLNKVCELQGAHRL